MKASGRAVLIGWIAAFLVIGGGATWWLLRSPRPARWHSPADAVRPWAVAEWHEAQAGGPGALPAGPPQFDRLGRLDWGVKEILLEYREADDGFEWPTEVITLGEGRPFRGGGRTVELVSLSVARPDGQAEVDGNSRRVAFRHFEPVSRRELGNGEAERVLAHLGHQQAYYQPDRWEFPNFGIGVATSGFEQPDWDGIRVFDRRTRVRLDSGSSYHSTDDGNFRGSCGVMMWHPGPVRVVLDLLHGPVDRAPVPLADGAVVELGPARMRVARVGEAPASRSSSSSGGSGTKSARVATDDNRETRTYLVIEMWPVERFAGLNWVATDRAGKRLSVMHQSGWRDPAAVFSLNARRAEIATLEAVLCSRRTRILVDVDGIPGLPEENRGITNLFDLRIPVTGDLDSEWHCQQVLSGLVQMQAVHSGGSPPGVSIPRFAAGTTPGEMAAAWNLAFPGRRIAVDAKALEIRFGNPGGPLSPVQRWLRRLRLVRP